MDLFKNAKDALDEYYNLMAYIDKLPVGDALDKLEEVAENLVDALTDLVYNE